MYICKNCGTKFDEPVIKESDNTIICCSPCCFGDFSEVDNCSVCKQPVINDRICRSCAHKSLERFESNNHSVFSLNYHLVLVVKYRRKVIDDKISERLQEIFEYVGIGYKITVKEWNHDKDHIHCLFSAHPKSELTKFLNAYKSASSRLVKKEFPQIKEKLWREYFWSRSFCLISTGGATIETIRKYIESQGEKSGKQGI